MRDYELRLFAVAVHLLLQSDDGLWRTILTNVVS